MSDADARFTLRDLPFPAKLVITCFLLSVGFGYLSAMVQLHFQDSKSGEAMPTPADVVLKFTGKKWFTEAPPAPTSRFVKLITTPTGTFGSNGTMMPAFFEKCPIYTKTIRDESQKPKIHAEREGERDSLVLWATAPDAERKKAYEADSFTPAADKMPKAITEKMKVGSAVKVKSIIDARCVNCHGKGEAQEGFPLETYSQIEKYLSVPETAPFKSGGDWVRVEEPMSLEKLTQSTHAHLLSFSVLFSLTGLVFAFTSYPTVVRCIISPLVLVAIVTDVTFWWLARLSEGYGVYFAMGVIGTGGIAGTGLVAQITLGLWNMYGPRGKVVIALIFGIGIGMLSVVMLKVAKPGLDAQNAAAKAKLRDAEQKQGDDTKPPEKKDPPKKDPEKKPDDKKDPMSKDPPKAGPSPMEVVLEFPLKDDKGMEIPIASLPWSKEPKKNMVRAFFDKDSEFANAMKNAALPQAAKNQLTDERHGELAAIKEWLKLPMDLRKKTYDEDAFPLPADLAKRPITADYVKNGKVTVKAILTDRCIRCHADDEKAMFSDFASMQKFMETTPAAKQPEAKPKDKDTPKALGPSKFDKVLLFPLKDSDGMELAVTKMPFTLKEEPRNMVRAFFDKDGVDYSKTMKNPCVSDADKKKLNDERFGELAAVIAWTKLADTARREAWNADALVLPPELAKKPITADYSKNGKVLIKALLMDRCIRCHADEPETMFKDYDTMLPLIEPIAEK
ncbi:MAG: hypothetical protein U0792_07115 [Gemmataceae bacterium]